MEENVRNYIFVSNEEGLLVGDTNPEPTKGKMGRFEWPDKVSTFLWNKKYQKQSVT